MRLAVRVIALFLILGLGFVAFAPSELTSAIYVFHSVEPQIFLTSNATRGGPFLAGEVSVYLPVSDSPADVLSCYERLVSHIQIEPSEAGHWSYERSFMHFRPDQAQTPLTQRVLSRWPILCHSRSSGFFGIWPFDIDVSDQAQRESKQLFRLPISNSTLKYDSSIDQFRLVLKKHEYEKDKTVFEALEARLLTKKCSAHVETCEKIGLENKTEVVIGPWKWAESATSLDLYYQADLSRSLDRPVFEYLLIDPLAEIRSLTSSAGARIDTQTRDRFTVRTEPPRLKVSLERKPLAAEIAPNWKLHVTDSYGKPVAITPRTTSLKADIDIELETLAQFPLTIQNESTHPLISLQQIEVPRLRLNPAHENWRIDFEREYRVEALPKFKTADRTTIRDWLDLPNDYDTRDPLAEFSLSEEKREGLFLNFELDFYSAASGQHVSVVAPFGVSCTSDDALNQTLYVYDFVAERLKPKAIVTCGASCTVDERLAPKSWLSACPSSVR